jgi:GT2 family glycosyltransferase
MTRLVVAIIVWNNSSDAIECAESLLRQKGVTDYTILFVDNDSKPAELERIKEFMATTNDNRFELTQTGENGGTAGGFSAAAKWAKDHDIDYVGALNADAVADEHWLFALHNELSAHPDSGIATGRVLHRDGATIDSTGDFYTTWGLPGPRGRGEPTSHAPEVAGYIFGATGGAFLARTKLYDTVGYYDRAMFMYYEDVDLSFRAQLAGYTVRYTPQAVVYHKRGASSSTIPGLATFNTFKNLPILFVKNVPLRLCVSMYPRFVLTYTLILVNAIVQGRGKPALKGYAASWKYLVYMFRERRRIQKSRSVSDTYISSILLHDIPPDQTGLRRFRQFFTGKP